jgi:hypothetical protein
MAGRNLYDLKRTGSRWRPSNSSHTSDFEALGVAEARRIHRAKLLGTAAVAFAQDGDAELALQVQALKVKLERGRRSRGHSLVDPVEIRRLRDIIPAHLCRFLTRSQWRWAARFITIIPRDWQCDVDTLRYADPTQLLNALRSQLIRCGAKGADGFLFVSIDVAYDLRHHVYQLHVHGIAAGGMLKAVQKLKDVPRFKSERCGDVRAQDLQSRQGVRVPDPVKISRKVLTRLPRPCLYLFKQQFFAYLRVDEADLSSPKVEQSRGYATKDLPEPANIVALLWRDQWDLNQTSLMMGMRVGRHGFKLL